MAAPQIPSHSAPPRRSESVIPGARGTGPGSLARARHLRAVGRAPSRGPRWGFFEGPPTANGPPGSHHVLARVFKDIFPRYKTMCGYYVERKGGWDCHGLPVELAVEAELGMKQKSDIEDYGIDRFNARCRELVLSHVEDWIRLTDRIGFWVDTEHAYKTLDPAYVESVWWALKTIHEKGAAVREAEGGPVLPALWHRALEPRTRSARRLPGRDRPVGVRDPAERKGQARRLDDDAVDAGLERGGRGRPRPDLRACHRRLHRRRVAGREGPRGGAEILERFPGSELVGLHYEPPFDYIAGSEYGPKGHTVLPADFVTDEDGTGLVHTAIAFGEDDFRLGEEQGLVPINPVRPDGTYDERITDYAGRWVKDADADLIEDLRRRWQAAAQRALRALIPPLLALRHAPALLRQAVLVHRDQPDQGSAARRQRRGQLAPDARQARSVRQVARGQRRLGAVARALLGHAAARLAVRRRACPA